MGTVTCFWGLVGASLTMKPVSPHPATIHLKNCSKTFSHTFFFLNYYSRPGANVCPDVGRQATPTFDFVTTSMGVSRRMMARSLRSSFFGCSVYCSWIVMLEAMLLCVLIILAGL